MIEKILNENKGKFAVLIPFKWNENSIGIHSGCLFYGFTRGIKFQKYAGKENNCLCVYNDGPKYIVYYYNLAAKLNAEELLMKDSEDRIYIIHSSGENEGTITETDKKWNEETVKEFISDKIADTENLIYTPEKYWYYASGMMARFRAGMYWNSQRKPKDLVIEKKMAEQFGLSDLPNGYSSMTVRVGHKNISI